MTGVLAGMGVLSLASAVFALDGQGVARLKRAGVGDATIELMVQERTVETAAFTVPDIVAMKAAGVGEAALQALIREGSFLKDREPVIYGNQLRSIRLTSAADIIQLKQAGVSDDVLKAIVEASRSDADAARDQALQTLREMGIWVDLRR
jgi:hypothetical protein